jgi:hypothetical protein
MTPLLLALPWARDFLPAPTPLWAQLVAAVGAAALAAWTAWMGRRQARRRSARVAPFRSPTERV